nr:MAG TPA: hypothetical protein [Inoviridae sp.]
MTFTQRLSKIILNTQYLSKQTYYNYIIRFRSHKKDNKKRHSRTLDYSAGSS